jgi:fido (protein-threonine AMPylation protein)
MMNNFPAGAEIPETVFYPLRIGVKIRGGIAEPGFTLPLSTEAQAVRMAVRAPVQMRRPVSYNYAFLNGYRPNESCYLSAETRQHLTALGKAQSAPIYPAGTHARTVMNHLVLDLSWNSSRLEGNTYSLLETEHLLATGATAEGKDTQEAQMILNHKAAIEFLINQAEETRFDRATLFTLHSLLAENLLSSPRARGRLRTITVGIGGTVYLPLAVPQLIEEYFDQILHTAAAISDPLEQAFFAMVHLPYLQPFEDVNKRVSRLAANIPLIRENVSPLSFVDVPRHLYVEAMLGVYELNDVALLRDVFIWAYERSCGRYPAVAQSLGDPDVFRMRYRDAIAELVSGIVRNKNTKQQATALARAQAPLTVRPHEQARFVEVIEDELLSLHTGNIWCYRLRPAEYEQWKEVWDR